MHLDPKGAIASHRIMIDELEAELAVKFQAALSMLAECIRHGGKILICGNGGSASDAAHFAAELVVRYATDRRAIPAIALGSACAVITAAANDLGYGTTFAREGEAYGRPGDVLVAISTSGKSVNVVNALHAARMQGLLTLSLSGARGNVAAPDVDICVPSTTTARIQEGHGLVIHLLCEALEQWILEGGKGYDDHERSRG